MPTRLSEGLTSRCQTHGSWSPAAKVFSADMKTRPFLRSPRKAWLLRSSLLLDSPYSAASRSRTKQAAKLNSCDASPSRQPDQFPPVPGSLDSDRRHAGAGAQHVGPTELGRDGGHHCAAHTNSGVCLFVAVVFDKVSPAGRDSHLEADEQPPAGGGGVDRRGAVISPGTRRELFGRLSGSRREIPAGPAGAGCYV